MMILSLIIFSLPSKFLVEIYTPSILGYFLILCFLVILICYLFLISNKLRDKKNKLKDTIFLLGFIGLVVCIWFYKAYKYGNI